MAAEPPSLCLGRRLWASGDARVARPLRRLCARHSWLDADNFRRAFGERRKGWRGRGPQSRLASRPYVLACTVIPRTARRVNHRVWRTAAVRSARDGQSGEGDEPTREKALGFMLTTLSYVTYPLHGALWLSVSRPWTCRDTDTARSVRGHVRRHNLDLQYTPPIYTLDLYTPPTTTCCLGPFACTFNRNLVLALHRLSYGDIRRANGDTGTAPRLDARPRCLLKR